MAHASKPNAAELKHVYIDLDFTREMMALKYGVPINTIKYWLALAGITKGEPDSCDAPKPGSRAGTRPSPEELRILVVDEGMSDSQIGAIYAVSRYTVKGWRGTAKLVGVRAKQRATVMAKIVEEAQARVVEKPKARPIAPAKKKTFTADEAQPYLARASESPFAEQARIAALRMVGRYA